MDGRMQGRDEKEKAEISCLPDGNRGTVKKAGEFGISIVSHNVCVVSLLTDLSHRPTGKSLLHPELSSLWTDGGCGLGFVCFFVSQCWMLHWLLGLGGCPSLTWCLTFPLSKMASGPGLILSSPVPLVGLVQNAII